MTATNGEFPLLCQDIDLLEVFDRVNTEYFSGACCAGIAWRNIRLGVKSQTLGVCELTERFIRINTLLSDIRVPEVFVEFIVYHEMLHLMVGRRHDKVFLEMEQKFKHYDSCIQFMEDTLPNIISEWRQARS